MTAKEYLNQAFLLDRKIKAKERQLESLKEHAVYVGPKYSDEARVPSSVKSALEEAVMRMIELEEYISLEISNLVRLRQEIAQAIREVNNPEYETLLEMRYLSFMKWDEISVRLGYGSNYVFQIHRKALELIRQPDG